MEKELKKYEWIRDITFASVIASSLSLISGLLSGWVGFLFILVIIQLIYSALIIFILKEE